MSTAGFNRQFFSGQNEIIRIGEGALGGKAQGLIQMADWIRDSLQHNCLEGLTIDIPCMAVLGTSFFDDFVKSNHLHDIAYSELPDDHIAHAFQKGMLPPRFVGDLRALAEQVKRPLAVRSSSLLEDALHSPFAGVYATKMIPNNQPDADTRFRVLVEAIKLVYASTFFRHAKTYMTSLNQDVTKEKMAVIIQEIVGQHCNERFYPTISGVARSYNFYSCGPTKPEDGVVNLALGLGKTIVDGGLVWSYSPAAPQAPPPYGNVDELLKYSQTEFWAVNMGKPPAYDPNKETEYLTRAGLSEADYDNTLRFTASTYDPGLDRIMPGVGRPGPRIVNFAPILVDNEIPLNDVIKTIISGCEKTAGIEVELEFAVNLDRRRGLPARFGLLQMRPMAVSSQRIDLPPEQLHDPRVIVASESALGNGAIDHIVDIVYVRPEAFDARFTRQMTAELERINSALVTERRPYIVIGYGRWGSADPWLGIPVVWSQLSGAKVIVETTLPSMRPEPSQGSHFFHNLTSFHIAYFTVPHFGKYKIDWEWIAQNDEVSATQFVRHVRASSPISVRVDGRCGRGAIARHD